MYFICGGTYVCLPPFPPSVNFLFEETIQHVFLLTFMCHWLHYSALCDRLSFKEIVRDILLNESIKCHVVKNKFPEILQTLKLDFPSFTTLLLKIIMFFSVDVLSASYIPSCVATQFEQLRILNKIQCAQCFQSAKPQSCIWKNGWHTNYWERIIYDN